MTSRDPGEELATAHRALATGDLAGAAAQVERLRGSHPDWPPAVHLAGIIARAAGVAVKQTTRFPLPHGWLRGWDACCVIGGDGTLLGVARESAREQVPIIGVGGILSGADAVAKVQAGANVVQIYTGLIYRGPALVEEAALALKAAAA